MYLCSAAKQQSLQVLHIASHDCVDFCWPLELSELATERSLLATDEMDINAPPDILAILDDGVDRKLRSARSAQPSQCVITR